MTDERRAAQLGTPVEPAMPASARDGHADPSDDGPRPPALTPSGSQLDGDGRGGTRESSPGVRRRSRMLRIPDDEVSRPSTSPSGDRESTPPSVPAVAAPEPAAPAPMLVPMRIITINPSEATSAPPLDLAPPFDDAAAPAAPDDLIPVVETSPDVEVIVAESAPDGFDTDEIRFDVAEETPTPAAPSVLPRVEAPPSSDRMSDPGSEISVEDVMVEEAPPPNRGSRQREGFDPRTSRPTGLPPTKRVPSQPPVPASRKSQPALPGKPPLVIVPPHVGTVGPQADGAGQRRKSRLWWEDLFNDDYLRACERLTDQQIAREVDFVEGRLGIERGGAVLDLGCGTGRHAIELARRGYEVVGFDLSLAMLARASDEAQDRGAKLNFVQGDMREMTFDEQFDGIYCWNTSFGYFEEDKNAHVVDRVRQALKPGGLFLLDVANRDFLVRQSPSLAWFEGDGCVCMDEMSVDFITSRMKVKRTMMLDDGRTREIEYSMRVYSLHELGKILHDHGFKVSEVSGRIATPAVFFGNESPRTIILAERR